MGFSQSEIEFILFGGRYETLTQKVPAIDLGRDVRNDILVIAAMHRRRVRAAAAQLEAYHLAVDFAARLITFISTSVNKLEVARNLRP